MATVRIDDKLLQEIKEWLEINGNKYEYPNVTAFVNNTIYRRLKELTSAESA